MQSQPFSIIEINTRLENLLGGFELVEALSANRVIRLGKIYLMN